MRLKLFLSSAGILLLALLLIAPGSFAQGPLYDKVMVNLPYKVTVGDHVLPPGDYVIRQLPSEGGASRVLLIYSDNGMKFETSAMTIPAMQLNTPEDTKIVLHHFGPDYYFDKVWIQGKNYGYEFPLPDSVKARSRERMEPINVAARYEAVPEQPKETAAATPPPQAEPAPAPAPAPEQPATQPAPAPQPQEQAAVTPPPSAERTMPTTAANWLLMLLGGGTLSGAGLMLRRRG
jgi:pyruvate/2-oxoglutarate dehydrogenase complex dihydrolipoamide acyltransferase (E2) component